MARARSEAVRSEPLRRRRTGPPRRAWSAGLLALVAAGATWLGAGCRLLVGIDELTIVSEAGVADAAPDAAREPPRGPGGGPGGGPGAIIVTTPEECPGTAKCAKCCKDSFGGSALDSQLIARGCICGGGLCGAECSSNECSSGALTSMSCKECVDRVLFGDSTGCRDAVAACEENAELGCERVVSCLKGCRDAG